MANRYGPKLAGANIMTTPMLMSRTKAAGVPEGMRLGDDFPMLCANCLGDSSFVRMMKLPSFSACRITGRPFNVFRWRPSKGEPYKQTIICYEIATEKNICQCCLNDLDYNIPMALRDSFERCATENSDSVAAPTSEVNQEYHFNEQLAKREQEENTSKVTPSLRFLELVQDASNADHNKMLYKNLPTLCHGWLKGQCNKRPCTFRPCCGINVFPELCDLFSQAEVDQVALDCKKGKKIDSKYHQALLKMFQEQQQEALSKVLAPPEDKSIVTLFVVGLPPNVTGVEISDLLKEYGDISKVKILGKNPRAFVEFKSRVEAENTIERTGGSITLRTKRLTLGWAAKKKSVDIIPHIEDQVQVLHKDEPLAAKPLPEILPGIPIPAGYILYNALPPAPEGLLTLLNTKPRKMPKIDKVLPPITYSDMYPSILPRALEGNIEMFSI